MKPHFILAVAISFLWSVPSLAQKAGQLELVYDQPVGGVYSQSWFAQVLGDHNGAGVAVYVVGEGKLGAFYGVISVDCQTPRYSSWLATGGFLLPDRVPDKAVQGIRKIACHR